MLCPADLKPCCDDLCYGGGCLKTGDEMIPTCGQCHGPMMTDDGEADTSGLICETCADVLPPAPGDKMSDIELTQNCALAMGLFFGVSKSDPNPDNLYVSPTAFVGPWQLYDPLHNDADAMAMVKRFRLSIGFNRGWGCVKNDENNFLLSGAYHYETLNQAIVQCVAHLHTAPGGGEK